MVYAEAIIGKDIRTCHKSSDIMQHAELYQDPAVSSLCQAFTTSILLVDYFNSLQSDAYSDV